MAYSGNNLALHEEIVLLALEDRKGTFQWSLEGPIVGAALFAELALAGRVEVPEDEEDPLVDVRDDEPLGNAVLDDALERMATANRRARLSAWVSRLGNQRGLPHAIARDLCRRGILREDETSVLLFFRRKIFPEVNPVPERRLIERLEKAIFSEGAVDERTAVLVGLADTAGVLRYAIEPARLKKRRRRIKEIRSAHEVNVVAQRVVETTLVAVMAATTAATTASVTAATS